MKKSFLRFTFAAIAALLVASGCSLTIKSGGAADGGVFRSEDGGIAWQQTVNAGKDKKGKPVRIDSLDVIFIRIDPKTPTTLYVSAAGAGIYRSDNGGDLWVRTGIPAGSYRAFTIDPSSTSIQYAATGGTIMKTSDGGAHWSTIYYESKLDRSFTDLAINPSDSSTLYAATNKGEVLLSKDYGNTWQLFSSIGVADSIRTFFFAQGNSSTMFALSTASGLFKSVNGGQTWVSLKSNMAKFQNAYLISSIATLPNKSDILYIASGYGLLMTADGGVTWQPIQTLVPFSSQAIQLVAVNPLNPNILYVLVGNRLRKSIDGGKTWDAKIVIPTSRQISTMTLNTTKPDELFVGTVKPKKK